MLLVPFCIQIATLFFCNSGIFSLFVCFLVCLFLIFIHVSEYISGFWPYGIIICATDEVSCIKFSVFGLSAQY